MARPDMRIEVSTKDQKELKKLLSGGVQQVRVVLRALALLQLARIFHQQLAQRWEAGSRAVAAAESPAAGAAQAKQGLDRGRCGRRKSVLGKCGHTMPTATVREAIDLLIQAASWRAQQRNAAQA